MGIRFVQLALIGMNLLDTITDKTIGEAITVSLTANLRL